MKFTNTTLSGLIAASLLGCVPVDESADLDQYVREEAAKLATQKAEEDKRELQLALAHAKAKDPKVIDVYYTVSPTGDRQLNIVRESEENSSTTPNVQAQPSNNHDTFTYAMAGMAAGMFMANMMNSNNNYSTSSYRQRSISYYSGPPSESQRRKRSGVATYVATSNAAISNRVYSQARSGSYSSSGRAISTSKGAFSGAGARSGSVGG